MLQAFAVEGGAAGRCAHQKTLGAAVGGQPDFIADALGAEHRVVNVKRNHVDAQVRVGRSGGDKRRHRTRLGDALLKDLAVFGFPIVAHPLFIHRLVKLSFAGINAYLRKQPVDAKRPRLVGDDRHHVASNGFVAQQTAQKADKTHRGGGFGSSRSFQKLRERPRARRAQRRGLDHAPGHKPTELAAALQQILDLRRVLGRTIEGRFHDVFVSNGNVESGAEFTQLLFVHFLLLVRNVAAFAGFAQSVALDGLGKDDRRTPFMFHRRLIGRIDLFGIVPAPHQAGQLFVRPMIDQPQQFRILPEEMAADVAARFHGVFLKFAIDGLVHPFGQKTRRVRGKQLVPRGAPHDLDDVPTGAAKDALQFLDDLAVAADRAVEALQIAVDYPDQVVQVLPRRQRDRSERFRFVALAIPNVGPDPRLPLRVDEPPRAQVAQETRLVNGHQRPQPHRHGRELPEIGHQIRMRIGRQPAALGQFRAEIVQMPLVQPIFQKGPRVIARRGVALEIMIVSHLVKRGHGGVTGDMTAHPGVTVVGIDDHGHGVPAGETLDAALHVAVAGIRRLLLHGNCIHIRRADRARRLHAAGSQALGKARKQCAGLIPAPALEHELHNVFHRFQRIARARRRLRRGGLGRNRRRFVEFSRLYGFHVGQFSVQSSNLMFKVETGPDRPKCMI